MFSVCPVVWPQTHRALQLPLRACRTCFQTAQDSSQGLGAIYILINPLYYKAFVIVLLPEPASQVLLSR